MSNVTFGKLAESYVVKRLTDLNYKVLQTNFRSIYGEIDIIASKYGYIYFVEVKARKSIRMGFPEESVTPKKLSKIKKTIEYYNKIKQTHHFKMKILVVSLLYSGEKVVREKMIIVN